MQVETFECTETAEEPVEACQEAIGICEQLGLEGQLSLVKKDGDEAKPVRCPYREMKADERFVYGVLCPSQTLLKQYALGPIPLRVLQIAAHAESLGIFRELKVWHAKETAIPDPVLIGVRQPGQYSWETTDYILARWGEELESWPTLLKRAVERKRQQLQDVFGVISKRLAILSADEQFTMDELIEKGPEYLPELRL